MVDNNSVSCWKCGKPNGPDIGGYYYCIPCRLWYLKKNDEKKGDTRKEE